MFNISDNGIVTVNRGDSFVLPVLLNIGSSVQHEDYVLKQTDVLYLGIMEPNQPFETAILRKKITAKDIGSDGSVCFRFWPKDTVCLLPGKYYYQVKLTTIDEQTGNEDVETIIDKTLFYIQE